MLAVGWLGTWTKRVRLTVDAGDIEEELTWFPLLIHLSASCGILAQDLTAIFDEVGASSLKLAVTKADGVSQLYVEVDSWSFGDEEAWLWVSRSDYVLDDVVDSELYLYYDGAQPDNVTYVGAVNSAVGALVWDANYVMVQHMADATVSTILDSTQYNNDGTKKANNEPLETSLGQIDGAQSFDGSNDKITVTQSSSLNLTLGTFEVWINPIDFTASFSRLFNKGNAYTIYLDTGTGLVKINIANNIGTSAERGTSLNALTAGSFNYIAITVDGANVIVYLAGGLDKSTVWVDTIHPYADNLVLGNCPTEDRPLKGISDENRISNSVRSPAWINACYETQRDHFLTFSDYEQVMPIRDYPALSNVPTLDVAGGVYPTLNKLPRECVLSLPLTEGNGDFIQDRSRYGNDGVNSGAAWTTGKTEKALSFLSDDYVTVADALSLRVTDPFTVVAWIYPRSTGQGNIGAVFDKGSYQLRMEKNELHFRVTVGGAAKVAESTGDAAPFNRWCFAVGLWDGAYVQVYVCGDRWLGAATEGPIDVSSDDVVIGNNTAHNRAFDGIICRPRIYNRALSPSEIRAVMNGVI